ncbi:MAG: zinc ribbon domain-containing protein [Bacteroidales bacterium]|nr:zinc ribbon domain-containing protein [Bacteroidales bacterium]
MSNRKKKKTAPPVTPPPPPPSPSERAQKLAEAEAIIRSENLRMAEERRNIKQCPNCGAPYPLVSNICPYCGHVLHEQQGEDFNIRTLIDNINASINTLKNAPKPTFHQVLTHWVELVFIYIVAAITILCVHYNYMFSLFSTSYESKSNGQMLIVVVVVAACAFLLHLFHSAKKQNPDISPLQQADNVYYSALHANEKYQRQIATIYGDNSEVKTLLEKLAAEIKAVQKVRNSNRLKLTMFLIGFTLIPLFLYIVGPTPRSRFEKFRDEHKSSFNMSSYSKTLKPLPEHPIADSIANYLTVDSDAYLSFEIVRFAYWWSTDRDNLCIRLDHVKIGYKGDKIEHPDSCVLKAVLYDKNMKPMSDSLVSYTESDYFEDTPLYTILRRGRSHYYESFASKKTYGLIDSLRRIADSAYYYSIY